MLYYRKLLLHSVNLVQVEEKEETEANLRRAVSSAYYALFHCYLHYSALALFGTTEARSHIIQAYGRSVSHAEIYGVARELEKYSRSKFSKGQQTSGLAGFFDISNLPQALLDFCEYFPALQTFRHQMDYNLSALVLKEEVTFMVVDSGMAIEAVESLYYNHQDALASFAAYTLFSKRMRG